MEHNLKGKPRPLDAWCLALVSSVPSMHMIAWGREDFLFAVELGELLQQHIGLIPAGGIGIGNPARAQKAEAIHQEFHVARQRSLSQQIGFGERSAKQGIASHDLM